MNTYRTTSPRVRGRVAAVAVAALLLSGLGSAPQALATPHVPEPGRDHGGQVVRWLSVGQLRREAAADRAQHLRWQAESRSQSRSLEIRACSAEPAADHTHGWAARH